MLHVVIVYVPKGFDVDLVCGVIFMGCQKRLSAAEQALFQSELSVTQIALDCGFCDGNYFSTVFKKHKGISPKDYRANAKTKRSN